MTTVVIGVEHKRRRRMQGGTFTVGAKKLASDGKPAMTSPLKQGISDPLEAFKAIPSLARAAGLDPAQVGMFLRGKHVDWQPL